MLVAHLGSIVLKNQLVEYVSKPMVIVVLAFYFVAETVNIDSVSKKWVLAALVFSWVGDVLLLFQQNASLFFLLGLSAFLLAHVFYIVFFQQLRARENIRSNLWFLVVVVIYYILLTRFLSPYLDEMEVPVRIYGIVISMMLLLAMHMLMMKNMAAGRLMMMGALLFVVSDSVLAINKFYQSFEPAGVVIMLTYGLAQLFIIEGAVRYITLNHKE